MNRIIGGLASAFLLGAAAILVLGASATPVSAVVTFPASASAGGSSSTIVIDDASCGEFRNQVFGFGDGFSYCFLLASFAWVSTCSISSGEPYEFCPPESHTAAFDQWYEDCLAQYGASDHAEYRPPWKLSDPHCLQAADEWAKTEAWDVFADAGCDFRECCIGLPPEWLWKWICWGASVGIANDRFLCAYYSCTGNWPGNPGDDDDTADDDTGDDDGEFGASLGFTSPTQKLSPMTTYDFDFTVANTSTTHASHWINQVEIFMPTEDYAIDPANVSSPDSLHGGGMWQAAIAKANEPHIRWDFLDGPTLSPVGDIRETESLDFSFRARTDPQGTDGFDYRIAADSGQFVADTAFVTHAGDPASAESDGVSDEAAATGAGPGDDDAFDDDAFDVDSDADDDDDAKADDDDDDDDGGGGLFSC